MTTLSCRVARLEREVGFRHWFRFHRWLETRTLQQLEDYIATDGTFPDPFPDPPPGSTPLDKLNRKALLKLWEEDRRWSAGRSSAELGFFADHGHWPEQACEKPDCSKPAFDELMAKKSKSFDRAQCPAPIR
jgi:hypothetical protein